MTEWRIMRHFVFFQDNMTDVKSLSIEAYMKDRGFEFRTMGGLKVCSSPFSRDTNWSFKVYPTNSFFDYANGFGGTIIDLVMRMDNCTLREAITKLRGGEFEEWKPNYKESKSKLKGKEFVLERYITHDVTNVVAIRQYATSRKITTDYECGVYFEMHNDTWVEIPAIMFVHVDDEFKPCGAKFRAVPTPELQALFNKSKMFSSRGRMNWYVLENINDTFTDPDIWVVESETSANSLYSYFKDIGRSAIVLSAGGVGISPSIPTRYQDIPNINIIIDYDGDAELYETRCKEYLWYEDFGLSIKFIKLALEKGDDINSLYQNDEMYKISNLLT